MQLNKKLGQHLLTDSSVISNMVSALELQSNDTIIEIGPGLGAVTSKLVKTLSAEPLVGQAQLFAVEFDARLIGPLKETFEPQSSNNSPTNSSTRPVVHVIHANILDWLPQFNLVDHRDPKILDSGSTLKIIGSLPYYITSPILHTIIKMRFQPEICVLLVQKEVAQKIAAQAPDASYLSVFIQTFFDIEFLQKVDKTKFIPPPKVDGAILKLTSKQSPLIDVSAINKYERFLHRGFASPRKMLNKVLTKEELTKTGISGNLRPQNLDVATWVEIFKK